MAEDVATTRPRRLDIFFVPEVLFNYIKLCLKAGTPFGLFEREGCQFLKPFERFQASIKFTWTPAAVMMVWRISESLLCLPAIVSLFNEH
jgi:hypothetical protein